MQNAAHLVGRDGVHAATKRDKLNEVHALIRTVYNVLCSRVQTGVIRPLVEDLRREFLLLARNGVFRHNNRAAVADEAVNAVVDLRVHMIRTTGQHDNRLMLFFGEREEFVADGTHGAHVEVILRIRRVGRFLHVFFRERTVREMAA